MLSLAPKHINFNVLAELFHELSAFLSIDFIGHHDGRCDRIPVVVENPQIGVERGFYKAKPGNFVSVLEHLGLEDGLTALVHSLEDHGVISVQDAGVVDWHCFVFEKRRPLSIGFNYYI